MTVSHSHDANDSVESDAALKNDLMAMIASIGEFTSEISVLAAKIAEINKCLFEGERGKKLLRVLIGSSEALNQLLGLLAGYIGNVRQYEVAQDALKTL